MTTGRTARLRRRGQPAAEPPGSPRSKAGGTRLPTSSYSRLLWRNYRVGVRSRQQDCANLDLGFRRSLELMLSFLAANPVEGSSARLAKMPGDGCGRRANGSPGRDHQRAQAAARGGAEKLAAQ